MGDRGNIKIKVEGEEPVYFYTHSGGYSLPKTVQKALARKQRWDDAPYLARIVFCELIKGDVKGETGFGISTDIGDNEHPIVAVNVSNQTVTFEEYSGCKEQTWSFESYVNTPIKALSIAFHGDDYE